MIPCTVIINGSNDLTRYCQSCVFGMASPYPDPAFKVIPVPYPDSDQDPLRKYVRYVTNYPANWNTRVKFYFLNRFLCQKVGHDPGPEPDF